MRTGDLFVYCLSGLQVCACVAYAVSGEFRRAAFWLCLASANAMFAGIK